MTEQEYLSRLILAQRQKLSWGVEFIRSQKPPRLFQLGVASVKRDFEELCGVPTQDSFTEAALRLSRLYLEACETIAVELVAEKCGAHMVDCAGELTSVFLDGAGWVRACVRVEMPKYEDVMFSPIPAVPKVTIERFEPGTTKLVHPRVQR